MSPSASVLLRVLPVKHPHGPPRSLASPRSLVPPCYPSVAIQPLKSRIAVPIFRPNRRLPVISTKLFRDFWWFRGTLEPV